MDLVSDGTLVLRGRKVTAASLSALVEGVHYVRCRECGAFAAMIHSAHLKACSGLASLGEYLAKHPGAPVMSERNKARKAKTPSQREAQSQKLKARFQTAEGDATRRQIADSSRRMQASESGQRCKDHLRKMNSDPAVKAQRRADTKARWESGALREAVEGWHREHRDESLSSALQARRYIQRKRTGLHLKFKALMESNGLHGFVTEYEVGYHAVDETRPDLKIAVEIDGCYWHSCPQCGLTGPRSTLRTDKTKTAYLTNRGWTVLRLWEHDINRDPMGCLDRIRQLVADKERENHVG
jgi:DNA mismatch endonuclease (patch repair protein)